MFDVRLFGFSLSWRGLQVAQLPMPQLPGATPFQQFVWGPTLQGVANNQQFFLACSFLRQFDVHRNCVPSSKNSWVW